LRVDELHIDEVDVHTAKVRTLYQTAGYETHLCGMYNNELVVYRVDEKGASLLAIDVDSLKKRTLIPHWPSAARDFSIDEASHQLVVQQRIDSPSANWGVFTIDLNTGQSTLLATSPSQDMAPHIMPGGSVLYTPEGQREPSFVGTNNQAVPKVGIAPGLTWVRALSPQHNWVASLQLVPGALPQATVFAWPQGTRFQVPEKPRERIEIVGFSEGGTP
jgi:hypothetical protein